MTCWLSRDQMGSLPPLVLTCSRAPPPGTGRTYTSIRLDSLLAYATKRPFGDMRGRPSVAAVAAKFRSAFGESDGAIWMSDTVPPLARSRRTASQVPDGPKEIS